METTFWEAYIDYHLQQTWESVIIERSLPSGWWWVCGYGEQVAVRRYIKGLAIL